MPKRGLLAVCVAVGVASILSSAEAEGASEPPALGHEVFQLYRARKLGEARAALVKLAREHVESAIAIKSPKRIDQQGRAGLGALANAVAYCFDLERKYGEAGHIPRELLEAAKLTREGIDTVVGEARRDLDAETYARIAGTVRYAEKQKAKLLVKEIKALLDMGRKEEAVLLGQRYSRFLTFMEIPTNEVGLPTVLFLPKPAEPERPQELAVSWETAAILQAVLEYYRALAAEDAAALNRVILQEPGATTGEDMIRELNRERETERDFDALGPVRFDSKTLIKITPKGGDEFEILLQSVLKSFRLGEHTFTQREPDRFRVRLVDGAFKIVMPQKKTRR